MYMDLVVLAGFGVVILTLGFFVGIGLFVRKDLQDHRRGGKKSAGSHR